MKINLNITMDAPERWKNAIAWCAEEKYINKNEDIDWAWIYDKVEIGLDHLEESFGLSFKNSPEEHMRVSLNQLLIRFSSTEIIDQLQKTEVK